MDIVVFDSNASSMENVCTGTILDKNRVMTSASCLHINKKLLNLSRTEKQLDLKLDFSNGETRDISYGIQHPKYSFPVFYHDISILHFKPDLKNPTILEIGDRKSLSEMKLVSEENIAFINNTFCKEILKHQTQKPKPIVEITGKRILQQLPSFEEKLKENLVFCGTIAWDQIPGST